MCFNEDIRQSNSQRKIIRRSNVILVYLLKLVINLGLVLGILFLTLDITSKLFSAITFLCACFFDIMILYVVNERMSANTKIVQAISIVVIIIFILLALFCLIHSLMKQEFNMVNLSSKINCVVVIVGIFSSVMEIICNIPIDD